MSPTITDRPSRSLLESVRALLLAVGLGACGEAVMPPSPPVAPTGPVARDEIVGMFDAIEMIFISGADTTDVLAVGGSLSLQLEDSAQAGGRLFAPGQGAAGSDIDEDMDGIWTYNVIGRVVTFTQQSPSFVGGAVFRPARTPDGFGLELTASVASDQFLGNAAVEVTLLRADPAPVGASIR